ncbi:MAG: glycosyltransferase [Candidatus Thermoplasmatota archaeon]|nr:glycosyltransferase [Candidatus Thermoplasmatota archaeon]
MGTTSLWYLRGKMSHNSVESFSIIIPTHNRYSKLNALLKSIDENRVDQLREIIIIDDSDSINEICPPQDIRTIHVKISFRIFISLAKNIGALLAASDYLFYIDDDNIVGENTFLPVMEAFSSLDNVGAVMPSIMYFSVPELVWVYATPFKKGKWGHELIGRNRLRNIELEDRLYDVDALPDSSMISKKALMQVNGFSSDLQINSSGDLTLKLKSAGFRVLATSYAKIYHDVPLPGKFGYWSVHGRSDPNRVNLEITNWFAYMRKVHFDERFFIWKALFHSLKFILPNLLTYIMLGAQNRKKLIENLSLGLLDSLRQPKFKK